MSFERKSMEYLVNRMIVWVQGVTTRLSDFRVGSKNRALLEALALVVEEMYDKLFRSIRKLIEDNIYAIFGFDKVPAIYATGLVTFSRSTPADQNYTILAGVTLASQASQYSSPVKFYTTADSILAIGTLSVDVPVICAQSGTIGNIESGTLTTFIQKPLGIEAVTNTLGYGIGAVEETNAEQKLRFQEFFEAQARGVLQSIEYGAKLAKILDPATGEPTEVVVQALAVEDLPDHKGEVYLYVWDGVGELSAELTTAVQTILAGYYDSNGNPVYGYKPAGILVTIRTAPMKLVALKVLATPEGTTLDLLKPAIEAEIALYFSSLKLGQEFVQSALQSNIKEIDGVYDVKLYLSIDDSATFTMDNVAIDDTEIAFMQGPVVYE